MSRCVYYFQMLFVSEGYVFSLLKQHVWLKGRCSAVKGFSSTGFVVM